MKDKKVEEVAEVTLAPVIKCIFRMSKAESREDEPVLDAVTVESEVSSDKADIEFVINSMTPVEETIPAAALDALKTRVAVQVERAEVTEPAKVPTIGEVVVEDFWDILKKSASSTISLRANVALFNGTPGIPLPLEEAVAPILPRAMEITDVTYA
jgi:hypothetical protein